MFQSGFCPVETDVRSRIPGLPSGGIDLRIDLAAAITSRHPGSVTPLASRWRTRRLCARRRRRAAERSNASSGRGLACGPAEPSARSVNPGSGPSACSRVRIVTAARPRRGCPADQTTRSGRPKRSGLVRASANALADDTRLVRLRTAPGWSQPDGERRRIGANRFGRCRARRARRPHRTRRLHRHGSDRSVDRLEAFSEVPESSASVTRLGRTTVYPAREDSVRAHS